MAKEPTVEQAIERARRAQEDRLTTIRTVAEARQALADVREDTARELAQLQARIAERVAEAEHADVRAYNAAVSAGWSTDELKKIGFTEPDKKSRTRRKAARKTAGKPNDQTAKETPGDAPDEGILSVSQNRPADA
jgi:hypothetical protein